MKKELWEDYILTFNPKLKSFKEEWKFLTKVSSQALANSYMDCMTAFNNFFNSLNGKSKLVQEPVITYSNTISHTGKTSSLSEE